jgi:hypothetical protein
VMMLSESKYPPGSDVRATNLANDESSAACAPTGHGAWTMRTANAAHVAMLCRRELTPALCASRTLLSPNRELSLERWIGVFRALLRTAGLSRHQAQLRQEC